MRAPRISIAGLMAFIALLGVTFSALHTVTEFAASAMLTLALVASGGALLGRLSTRGTAKAAWTGYLVFGTGYLAMCVGPWCDEHVMPNLVTAPSSMNSFPKWNTPQLMPGSVSGHRTGPVGSTKGERSSAMLMR
jgi:hypothetical protein